MTDSAQSSHRLTELESKLAFAEDLIETLNQTVARQQTQIDSLQAQLRVVYQQMQAITPQDARSSREELPPHY
jgi:SlyX protein